jgi:hypothetical protein
MRTRSLLAVAVAVLAVAVTGVAGGSRVAVKCALWAAPYGVDTNPGSQVAPFLTLTKLAATLAPGQTGCLPAGTSFAKREVITAVGTPSARITIKTAPGGDPAVLADGIETTQATRFLTLSNLAIRALNDSGGPPVSGTVVLRGYSTALTRSDVGPGNLAGAGRSCVVLDHAGAALVDRNVLHNCNGASPGLYGAGVLASTSVGAVISSNVIFGNAGGDALAFAPNAQLSVARRNLLFDNLNGIYFGGGTTYGSRDNKVQQNVIALDHRFDVHGVHRSNSAPMLRNVVRLNCIFSPGAQTSSGTGYTMRANRKVHVHIVKADETYRLAPTSKCRPYRPLP